MSAQRVIAAAAVEILTACLLIVAPALFARLLLGEGLSDAGGAIGRLAGIVLLALALACWPRGPSPRQEAQPFSALLVFNVLCALVLMHVGIGGEAAGMLLWPAAGTHAALALLLVWSKRADRRREAAG
jgi:hypothetical protein